MKEIAPLHSTVRMMRAWHDAAPIDTSGLLQWWKQGVELDRLKSVLK